MLQIILALVIAITTLPVFAGNIVWECDRPGYLGIVRLEGDSASGEGEIGNWTNVHGVAVDHNYVTYLSDLWEDYDYPYGMHAWDQDMAVDRTLKIVISTNPYHNQPDENGKVSGKATLTLWNRDSGLRIMGEQYTDDLRCKAEDAAPESQKPEGEDAGWID